jgi:phosphohistidine phosphatase SixA
MVAKSVGATLTPGIKRMQKAARAAVCRSFDRILTSPLERARETAKIVAQTLQLEERVEEIKQLSPDQSVQDLRRAGRLRGRQRRTFGGS